MPRAKQQWTNVGLPIEEVGKEPLINILRNLHGTVGADWRRSDDHVLVESSPSTPWDLDARERYERGFVKIAEHVHPFDPSEPAYVQILTDEHHPLRYIFRDGSVFREFAVEIWPSDHDWLRLGKVSGYVSLAAEDIAEVEDGDAERKEGMQELVGWVHMLSIRVGAAQHGEVHG